MDVKFLDTYALVEISKGNPDFIYLLRLDFGVLDLILAELYTVLLREDGRDLADFWYKKLEGFATTSSLSTLIRAVKYRHENKKQNLSFFDCVGYIFARENNMKFVTGDKEFENKEGVEFIKCIKK